MVQTSMTYPQHLRAIAVLGLPLVGGNLAQFAISLTDTVMVGWYGVEALAALTLASMTFFVFFLMGAGFGWAVTPMVAQFHAQGDDAMIRRTARMGLWLVSLVFALAYPVVWNSAPLLERLGQTPELAEAAQTYLRIAGLGLWPALGVVVIKGYLAALERTRIVFIVTAGAAIFNAIGNYALIFGNFGAPELGLRGAAMASVATQLFSLLCVALYAARVLPQHTLFSRLWRPDSEMFARVFRLGWPISLTSLSEVGLFAASTVMMGWLGTVPLAAHGIAIQVASATFVVHLGLSEAATVRAGNALGRRDREHARRGAATAIVMSVILSACAVAVFLSIPETLVNAFLDDEEPQRMAIIGVGVTLISLAAGFQLVDGMQVIALGLLRGLQDTRVPMIVAVLSYLVLGVGASYVLGFVVGWGGAGVWLGLVLGLTASSWFLMVRFWRVTLRRAFSAL